MVRAFDLQVLNDGRATRSNEEIHSVIYLTLASPGAKASCQGWALLGLQDQASTSDYEMVEWKWKGATKEVDASWKIRGWALKERVGKEKEGDCSFASLFETKSSSMKRGDGVRQIGKALVCQAG